MAVAEGRAMVRVRKTKNGDLATIGVCPACWNIKERRRDLLIQLKKLELEVVHRDDLLEGAYRPGRTHAPGCRHAGMNPDPWKRFESQIKKFRR
jgi:predicted DsbA family dithiol-disulfide isomerase